MDQANQAKLAELEQLNGPCAHIEKDGTLFVWRTPTCEEWDEAQAGVRNPKVRNSPLYRQLAQKALVYPELPQLQALFAKRPAIAAVITDALSRLAGAYEEIAIVDEQLVYMNGGKRFAWRTPTLDEYEEFQDSKDERSKPRGEIFRDFAAATLLEPSSGELDALLKKFPALRYRIGDTLTVLAGAEEEIVVKKG